MINQQTPLKEHVISRNTPNMRDNLVIWSKTGVVNEHVHYAIYNNNMTNMHKLVYKTQALVETEVRLSYTGRIHSHK